MDPSFFDESISAEDIEESSLYHKDDAPSNDTVNSMVDMEESPSPTLTETLQPGILESEDLTGQIERENLGHGWVNDALDETRFESDEDELEAIQNMVKSQNSQIIFEETTTEERAALDDTKFESDEEELQAIQNMIKSQNEGTLFENRNEKETKITTEEFSKEKNVSLVLDSIYENKNEESKENMENVPAYKMELNEELVNNQTYPRDNYTSYDQRSGESRSGRYEQDPLLPEGWKKATYYVKKTGMKLYRYVAPGGQKFTSRKLVVNFMKENGYSEEEVERAMEGSKLGELLTSVRNMRMMKLLCDHFHWESVMKSRPEQ